jgi:phytanoyl-CoA dioxygenase PhyH
MIVESHHAVLNDLARDGFAILPNFVSSPEARALGEEISSVLHDPDAQLVGALATATGVYAARNVLKLWPKAATVWRRSPLVELLSEVLGGRFGLVRVLFFDKPPNQTWALPWHKDLTIAVRNNKLPSASFVKPTTKAGVPHVEAPVSVLQEMLTVRLHLDEVTNENGPLRVIPGSHLSGKKATFCGPPVSIHATAGDALLMRPLLMHCSNQSQAETKMHRRILHFEFAANASLPDRYEWHSFIAGN